MWARSNLARATRALSSVTWARELRSKETPRAFRIRLSAEVKRPGTDERHWIGLKDDPDTKHVTLKLR